MRLRYIIKIAFIFSIFNSCSLYANEHVKFPVGCKPVGFKYDLYNVIFTPSAKKSPQTIYFIHNVTGRQIYLHEADNGNEPYIIHLNGTIDTAHWSVLAVAKDNMKFNCAYFDKSKQMHEVTSCREALAICQFPRAKFGPNQHGTYWVLYNASQSEAMGITKEHGVWLNPRSSSDE